jgi:hypothetical protein
MIALFSHAPVRLVVGAVVGAALAALLAAQLGWHAWRRLFGVPRVPRGRATYVVMAALWGGLMAACGATVVMALMLRDHQPVDGRHPLGELRCEAIAPGHLRVELTGPSSPTPEHYDLGGDACVVAVVDVELRPALRILGLRELARVEGVGPLARPRANADWLTPHPEPRGRLLDLLVRRTQNVSVVVPADAQERFLVVTSPGRPTLAAAHI